MESRGYQGGEGRSKYRILKWQRSDTLLLLSLVIVTAILVAWHPIRRLHLLFRRFL